MTIKLEQHVFASRIVQLADKIAEGNSNYTFKLVPKRWFSLRHRCCGVRLEKFKSFYKTSGRDTGNTYFGCVYCLNTYSAFEFYNDSLGDM